MKRFLIKHVGNMGDMVFFIPPVLATLKKKYPDCHITFVTAWGIKDPEGRWGKRNQGGFSINLMMTNPYINQLVHWHDFISSPDALICLEEGRRFPTWNREYFDQQAKSGSYDAVYELDFGITYEDNPLGRMYEALGLSDEKFSNYKIYLSASDRYIAGQVMRNAPKPRIVMLEGIDGQTTRGWDGTKLRQLEETIQQSFGTPPLWFGGFHVPDFAGRPLTLRENIALLTLCDVGIGVMSGALHFAAAVGLPTITLFCDQPLHRAAPAYFLNRYVVNDKKRHRTLLGPSSNVSRFLKSNKAAEQLTATEKARQNYKSWTKPGKQMTKSCLAVITVEEIMAVLQEMI